MLPRLAALLLICLIPGSGRAEPYVPLILTADQAGADVALLRRGLEMVHPGLYRYRGKGEIDAAFARLEAAAGAPIEALALHRAIAVMLAEIHCDHTKPELSEALDAYRRANATHLPFRFLLLEGRMIVVSTDGQPGAPPRAAEILTINGRSVPDVLASLSGAVAFDGTTDQAIAVKLASDGDLMGDDFDEYYPSFFGFAQRWEIGWKRLGQSAVSTVSLDPIRFDRWRELAPSFGPQRDEFYNAIGFRLSGKTAQLRIDTFVNYRNPVDADAFLGGFFKSMRAAGTDHLILDLRNNGGGSEDVSVSLGRHLLAAPFVWGKPARLKAIRYGDLPAHIESWGNRDALFNPPESAFTRTADGWFDRIPTADETANMEQRPVADRFSGALTILTGPMNGSGATRTVAQLKQRRGATLVGEETSGSAEGPTAGQIFLLTLPNSGIKVRIPNAWNRTNIDRFTPGRGVGVDRQVTATLADFEDRRDRVLDAVRKPNPAAAPAVWPMLLASALAGNWAGTLDYRDYGNGRRVTLPTRLDALQRSAGVVLRWTYDDGPGKIVRSKTGWTIDPVRRTLSSGGNRSTDRAAIIEFDCVPKTGELTLVADGKATENGAPVIARTIVTRRGARLRITRMTRKPGQPFLMRDAYELTAISPA